MRLINKRKVQWSTGIGFFLEKKKKNLSRKSNRSKKREKHRGCHHRNKKVSYNSVCNCNCNMNGQRNPLLVFPIVECLFLIVYLYLSCVNCYSRISR